MNDLYRHELRLWMNVFQPSVMLVRRVRVGMRLRRVYEAAQASREGKAEVLAGLRAQHASLDSVRAESAHRGEPGGIYELARRRWSPFSEIRFRSQRSIRDAKRAILHRRGSTSQKCV
jgi:hypothetical protein